MSQLNVITIGLISNEDYKYNYIQESLKLTMANTLKYIWKWNSVQMFTVQIIL